MDEWEEIYDDNWEEEPTDIESRELFEPTNEEEYAFEGDEDFDDAVLDIDYSEFKGDFRNCWHQNHSANYKTIN